MDLTYDEIGNPLSYHNGGASTKAADNPFTYRGYYYDKDLNLYRLGTRYYDARMGRFISPDRSDVILATPNGLTDKNLYAYCDNNPVMRVDEDGEFWLSTLIGATVGAIVGGVFAALGGGDLVDVIVGTVAGATGGALTASGIGVVGQVIGSTSISMVSNAVSQIKDMAINDTWEKGFNVADMLFDGVVSGAMALWGKNGATHGNDAGIKASWKQLTKKGLTNSNARKYFYKTAHNSANEFVFTSLGISSAKNLAGSAIITAKNWILNRLRK